MDTQLYPAELLQKRRREVLYDTKWQLFMKRAWLFRHIPFIEGVFGSGSLALGNVTEHSDFDVLILAKNGRIFSARFFAVLAFNLFGWRRQRLDHRQSAKDKVCLNHFVTRESYRLTLAPNAYWKTLYGRLVPMYGRVEVMNEFFKANVDWLGAKEYQADIRHNTADPSYFKLFIEWLFASRLGDRFERFIKAYQVGRIQRGLPKSRRIAPTNRIIAYQQGTRAEPQKYDLPPLIRYSDTELEFHPDPATVEVY